MASIMDHWPRVSANTAMSFSMGPIASAADRKDSTARLTRWRVLMVSSLVGFSDQGPDYGPSAGDVAGVLLLAVPD
jgi:hypothetical protein